MARSFTPAPLDASNVISGFGPGLPPPVDVVELLPVSRRSLLLSLRQRTEDAQSLVRPLHEQLDELRAKQHLLSARLAELRRPRGQGGPGLGDDDVSVVDAKNKLAVIDAEMARINELIEPRRARSRSIAASIANIVSWLREGRPSGTTIVQADFPEVATILKRGETVAAALDRIRHRLRELAADKHRVQSAPFPPSHAKARARAMMEQLAERGAIDVGPLVEADIDFAWPMMMQRLGLAGIVGATGDQLVGSAAGEIVDTAALFVWLHKGAIIEKLEAEIDAIADDADALSPEDRQMKLAEIDADRLMIERQECALVRAMQADGLPVEHRADADPRAVLGVALEIAAITQPEGRLWGMAATAAQHVVDTLR